MQKTGNFELNQWDLDDRIQMADFNSDNSRIDAALTAVSGAVTEHGETLATRGNCRIWTSSYTGTSTASNDVSRKASCTFPETPLFFLVFGSEEVGIFCGGMGSASYLSGTSNNRIYVSWAGTKATWYHSTSASAGLNLNTTTYQVIAFLPPKD